MRISELYNLQKSQAELDFIDIDVDKDVPLFLDPFFLGKRVDRWSAEANSTIRSFFQQVLDLLKAKDVDGAKELFIHLTEPNATCLGMSKGKPRGRGVGRGDTDDIFVSFASSKAARTGLIQDLEDNVLFVEGFGKDKLSDMTTNIIRNHLIEYTQQQCKLHGITMQTDVPTGFYWNRRSLDWEQDRDEMLVIDSRVILFVPKGVVSFSNGYTPEKYYNHFVLNFMQNDHLRINSALVQKRKDGRKFVTKKDLKERNPLTKDFLAEFSKRNPQVLREFKSSVITTSLSNNDITDINMREVGAYLIQQLGLIEAGSNGATGYHRLISGILELIFYPHLIYPTLEQEIHSGRKRIDIKFDNAAVEGIFFRFSNNMNLPCQYIMVECKNYSSDPTNPELDQLSGRFGPNRGVVGFLLCRTIDNMDRFIERCRDTFRDNRGLIIPIVDSDIIDLLNNFDVLSTDYVDRFLSDRVRRIAMN